MAFNRILSTPAQTSCGICMEDYSPADGDNFPVAHEGNGQLHPYHVRCIKAWNSAQVTIAAQLGQAMIPRCPSCQTPIQTIDGAPAEVNHDALIPKYVLLSMIEGAARLGNTAEVQALLRHANGDQDPLISEERLRRAFHGAGKGGQLDTTRTLLLDPTFPRQNEESAMSIRGGAIIIAATGSLDIGAQILECVRALLQDGPISREKRGSAITVAAEHQHWPILRELLLPAQANEVVEAISEENRGFAVEQAAKRGNLEVLELLLANGPISIGSRSKAVVNCEQNGALNFGALRLLIANGPIEESERKRLFYFYEDKDLGFVRELVQTIFPSGVISADIRGELVEWCVLFNHLDYMRELLPGEPIPELSRADAIYKTLYSPIPPNGRPALVRELLQTGPIPEINRSWTVKAAASQGDREVMQILLQNGPITPFYRVWAIAEATYNLRPLILKDLIQDTATNFAYGVFSYLEARAE